MRFGQVSELPSKLDLYAQIAGSINVRLRGFLVSPLPFLSSLRGMGCCCDTVCHVRGSLRTSNVRARVRRTLMEWCMVQAVTKKF